MSKKFLVLLIALFLGLFIVGCGKATLTLSETEVKLLVGESYTINPVTDDVNDVEYVVKDTTLLSISGNKITALKAGTTSVELSLKSSPDVKASLSVIIEDAPAVVITGSNIVYHEEEVQLTATLVNVEGEVVWESDNESVVSVDANGKVKGLKLGSATISAKVGEVVGTFDISVQRKPEITISGADEVLIEETITLKAS